MGNSHDDAAGDVMVEAKKIRPLTSKQELFLHHYLGDARFNGLEAARRAGYSAGTVGNYGQDILRSQAVQQRIGAYLAVSGANMARTLAAFLRIAFDGDMADFEPFLTGGKSLAEVAVPQRLFRVILERIRRLRLPETVPG